MIKYVKRIGREFFKAVMPTRSPDFFIVGAQKAGTTALYHYLNQHPSFRGTRPKEIHYFDRKVYSGKDIGWYQKHFYSISSELKHFEATPEYIYYKGVAKSICENYPDAKIIMVLRNPVERAFSAWNMYRQHFENDTIFINKYLADGSESPMFRYYYKDRESFPTFRECIDMEVNGGAELMEEPSVIRRGLYYDQIMEYYEYFDEDQVMVIGSKDLYKETSYTLNRVLDFLDVDSYDWDQIELEKVHKRNYSMKLSDSDRERLEKFYSESNTKLFNKFGQINW